MTRLEVSEPIGTQPAVAASLGAGDRPRWIQVLSHISSEFGGIAASVPELARATEETGAYICDSVAFCSSQEIAGAAPSLRNTVRIFSPSRLRNLLDFQMRRDLYASIQSAKGIHIHGLWETHCTAGARLARAIRRPYIVSAHGMLDAWSVRQKRFKKAFYAALIETPILKRAACLRALTSTEADDYRRIGLPNPIVVVPNGVAVPPAVTPELFFELFPKLAEKRIALFLGRLHAKKGVDLLLEAWSGLCQGSAGAPGNAHLVIAGPCDDATQTRLHGLCAPLGIENSVTFTGMLAGSRKWAALAAAHAFVLPSHSEGFSVSILEALAMALPVIISEPCHMPEVGEHGAGWVVRPEPQAVRDALAAFYACSQTEAEAMGYRGRRLAHQHYAWSVVGRQMAEVYQWLEGGPKPQSVEVLL
ncbi:MAG: glycosyltransferase [Bryobacterales bacterium]|nr:glycosyltransferase [Bryobacterales bacterium]